MMKLFSRLGRFLDSSRLELSQKKRFSDIQKILDNVFGKIGVIFLIILFLILSILWVWFYATHPTPGKFFKIEQKKHSVSLLPTSRSPKMSTSRVRLWLRQSLMDTYTFNFTNVNKVLSGSKLFFRDDTYNKFILGMNKKDGIVDTVVKNSLEVSFTPESNVKVLRQGRYGGIRVWQMELKALIYYSGALKELPPPQHVVFQVLIQQVPTTENPYGLEITQLKQSRTN